MSSRWQVRAITAVAMLALGAAGGLVMAQTTGTYPGAGAGTQSSPTSPGAATTPGTRPYSGTATSPGTTAAETTEPGSSAAALSKSDKTFMHKAAQGGLAEVQLGQLAQQQGGSDAVKEFGQRMVTDHQAANEKLQSIAQAQNVELPTTLSKRDQEKLTKLQSLHGAAFDKAYVSDMRRDHKTDIKEFEHEAKHGKDAQIKQFADSTLPTLKEHLAMAEKLDTSGSAR